MNPPDANAGHVTLIEDYAVIGDTETAALVGVDGSIDWLCLPRFDSGACFAALLGTREHGHWRVAPVGPARTSRRYRPGTAILETTHATDSGSVTVVDFMPPRLANEASTPDVIRIVEGVAGTIELEMVLAIRFDYGAAIPWVRQHGDAVVVVAGPDALVVHSTQPLEIEGAIIRARFTVQAGETSSVRMIWYPSHLEPPSRADPRSALQATEHWWQTWSSRNTHQGTYREVVGRSLVTLKLLTYGPTGGIVAAPTTSLPEQLGGTRNWDYRYCWLRDAAFTLSALIGSGYLDEARAWRDWLLRAVAGHPAQIQSLYGVAGERRLTELELPWLPGYEGAVPVRIGNAATAQFQLDVYGEILDMLLQAARAGLEPDRENGSWLVLEAALDFVELHWRDPDEGIWEIRGPRLPFTHSKVMAWVAIDRAIQLAERTARASSRVPRWRSLRDEIHADICAHAFDLELNSFVQSYGSKALDASLLLIPIVGFLPPDDPRVLGTVAAIERHLASGPFVARYSTETGVDGLPAGEGTFLICAFWLVDALAVTGRLDDARRNFQMLLAITNDLGLLAEEYEPSSGRQLGNFPQALSHIGLVNSAVRLHAMQSSVDQPGASGGEVAASLR